MIVFGGPASALLQSDTTALHRSLRDNGPAGITNAWRMSSLGPQSAALGAVALSQRAFFAIPPLLQPGNSRASLEVASWNSSAHRGLRFVSVTLFVVQRMPTCSVSRSRTS